MHDCASAHCIRSVRDVLNNTYHDVWIGRGGSTAWPPRSPDFNPLNFYLWGHLKTIVYAAPVDNEPSHCGCLSDHPNYSSIFAQMHLSVMRRVEACIECHGGIVEHLF
jgi:hypothetical protein